MLTLREYLPRIPEKNELWILLYTCLKYFKIPTFKWKKEESIWARIREWGKCRNLRFIYNKNCINEFKNDWRIRWMWSGGVKKEDEVRVDDDRWY